MIWFKWANLTEAKKGVWHGMATLVVRPLLGRGGTKSEEVCHWILDAKVLLWRVMVFVIGDKDSWDILQFSFGKDNHPRPWVTKSLTNLYALTFLFTIKENWGLFTNTINVWVSCFNIDLSLFCPALVVSSSGSNLWGPQRTSFLFKKALQGLDTDTRKSINNIPGKSLLISPSGKINISFYKKQTEFNCVSGPTFCQPSRQSFFLTSSPRSSCDWTWMK